MIASLISGIRPQATAAAHRYPTSVRSSMLNIFIA